MPDPYAYGDLGDFGNIEPGAPEVTIGAVQADEREGETDG